MDEPVYRVWMQESVPPQAHYDERPGRWVAEPSWPSPDIEAQDYACPRAGSPSGRQPGRERGRDRRPHAAVPWHRRRILVWLRANADGPWDQRADDGMAVCFDTAPLPERLEILGAPVVTLELSSDRPNAFLCARLCDVAPDGASLRVTYGLLNLTHRASHEHPEPLEPGRRYPMRLQLNDVAHAFPAGHRIRLALSTTYWPIAWPSPEAATVTVSTAGSRLVSSGPHRAREDDASSRPSATRRARRPSPAPRCARAASSAASAMTSRPTP